MDVNSFDGFQHITVIFLIYPLIVPSLTSSSLSEPSLSPANMNSVTFKSLLSFQCDKMPGSPCTFPDPDVESALVSYNDKWYVEAKSGYSSGVLCRNYKFLQHINREVRREE